MRTIRLHAVALPMVGLAAAASVAVAALPAVGAGSAASPRSAVAVAEPVAGQPGAAPTPAALLTQRLAWRECLPGKGFPRLECAALAAPRDWNHPASGRISLVVSRIRAGDSAARRGVLFTNPGGPGEPGLAMPLFISVAEPEVAAAYDVVGMDLRGTGSSTPLACVASPLRTALYGVDGRNLSGANQRTIATLSKQFATQCAKSSYTKVVNTAQIVRDVDLLRAVLREKKLSYLGYSAGTWLGAWYATTFPTRVNRMVLDGNVDFTAPWYASFARQPAGFQASFEGYFLPWVARYNDLYGQGATAAAVKQGYEARRAALARAPLTLPDGTLLTAPDFDNAIAAGLYWSGSYPDTAAGISILAHWDTASDEDKALATKVFGGGGSMISGDAFWAITCQDTANPTPAKLLADTAGFRKSYPLLGATWNVDPCAYWPGKPAGSPVTGKKLPPLLMINNAADPATPLANARAARRHVPSAVLITVSGEPDHTIYGEGDPCVERIANAWLLDGVLPTSDAVCRGLALPDPTAGTDNPSPSPSPSPSVSDPAVSASGNAAVASAGSASASRPVGAVAAGEQEKPHRAEAGIPAQVWVERFSAFYGTPVVGQAG